MNTSMEAKAQLGYIPEMPAVYDLLTVSEHLEFIRRAYKIQDTAYEEQLLERLELNTRSSVLGKELSKGMQQKLSICCALAMVHRPRVAIFDEPLVGLDPPRHQRAEGDLPGAEGRGLLGAHLHPP